MNSRTSSNVPLRPPSAIARAEALFHRCYPEHPFVYRLSLYMKHAYVVVQPDLFGMFKPVSLERDPISEVPRADVPANGRPDAWYVDLVVGELGALVRQLPYPLPNICFYRHFRSGPLRVYRLDNFLERCPV